MLEFLSGCAALASLGGNLLIMLKKKSGWLVWILGNILWILYNWLGTWNWPMVIMYFIYFVINIAGFVNWSRKEN